MPGLRPLGAALPAFLAALALATPLAAETDEARALLDSTRIEDAERAAELYEAQSSEAPESYAARLGAATALAQVMAIRTNGNLPLFDGLQDTEANRKLWSELAPRAVAHARAALALRPDSPEAAAALATSYMFQASSLGILRSILGNAGGEFRTNAQRVIDLDPAFEDGVGHTLLGGLYLVAPWPVGDSDLALEHYERAAQVAPRSARNQYSLGVYWAREGDEARARAHFERAVEMPCAARSERLFCDFLKRESQRALSAL